MNRNRLALIALAAIALLAIAAPAYAGFAERGRTERLEFEVAEDMTRFVFDKDVSFEDGLPADGSSFITRGYLYAPGTLTCDADGACNGVNEDGSPEFPDKLIGEWICSGYMINDAGHAKGGVWVFSTQFFQLSDTPGAETIVSTGYELADLGVAISRAITGGTGDYKDARGQGEQTLLGFNAGQGVTLKVRLDVRTR
ncbi:MAG: hypothetical protein OHK0015_42170 [Chloroflexi bacterium OHK40]